MLQTLKTGLLSGLKTTWTLGKIIFPITLLITILQYTPILPWIIKIISPLMGMIGLSGDAAIPIVLGNFLNLYAGIAGILSVDLTVKEVFIIAVMLSFAHNLFIESSVAIKVGVRIWVMIVVRVGLAILSAIFINLFWHGGHQPAHYSAMAPVQESITGVWPVILDGIEKAALGVYKLAEIVIPLMIGIQILKDLQLLKIFSRWMAPVTRLLGMKENTSTTLAAGLFFGLAYGAGVMIQAVQEDGVSKKDATLAFIFLCGCHAVVEDTLIFVPLGIPVIYLLLVRLFTAIILTFIVGFIWNRMNFQKSTPTTIEG
ncbi:nucleoside recognition domain-containing protein [Bacillus sp. FJAT-49736]|uniref:nucleoside recognition domain-containing protein n=1 Tax=Bacillus sp. FJAT-49736 TaxID=2833582 RepID=UPI001BCA1FBE|nr:nucleoside recognition domain-containing protein [Bacillus sp. FJAT-49736]MBS4174044.1 nucleoside recognition domain-containing protein [Bacillus sp. FJAT-49736]